MRSKARLVSTAQPNISVNDDHIHWRQDLQDGQQARQLAPGELA
jgi:hypothetical protein